MTVHMLLKKGCGLPIKVVSPKPDQPDWLLRPSGVRYCIMVCVIWKPFFQARGVYRKLGENRGAKFGSTRKSQKFHQDESYVKKNSACSLCPKSVGGAFQKSCGIRPLFLCLCKHMTLQLWHTHPFPMPMQAHDSPVVAYAPFSYAYAST